MYYTDESLLPSTTRFSNSGRSSSRTDLASNSSAPRIGRATSYPTDRGAYSFLERSIEVLREPLGVPLILVAIGPVILGKLLQQLPSAD